MKVLFQENDMELRKEYYRLPPEEFHDLLEKTKSNPVGACMI